ncbi:hypothetical protein Taro_009873 [Colocasia esculenta]|uniref:Protein kinase domain-containing protein n=1 Tax=Colocasia esculenta TaxID=4460 RepID=A0A843U633_COLES|nr:hypothetical protein [Colocasia esculenta]
MFRSPGYGSRKSGSGGKTPDRWELSRSSVSSEASSGGRLSTSSRNPVKAALGALGACFAAPPEARTERAEDVSVGFHSSLSGMSGSSRGSVRRRSGSVIYQNSYNSSQMEPGGIKFSLAEIYKATKNFSPSFKIGQGGFGTVYKGILEQGNFVAVKRAKKSIHEKHLGVEFRSEVQTLARVEHLNLVRFYGYLEHEDERIIVVEYVPNGTLREHLDCLYSNPLDLAARLDIAIDVAHAVTYLHTYAVLVKLTLEQAMNKFTEGNALKTLDPNLLPTHTTNFVLEKVFELALQCLAPTRQTRPSMRRCAEMLWSIRKDYRELLATETSFSPLHPAERRTSSAGEGKNSP